MVVRDFVPVIFFDIMLRECLEYHFREMEPQRLYLTMATRRMFCDPTQEMFEKMQAGRAQPNQPWAQYMAGVDRVIEGTSLIFKPDGITIRRTSRHGDPNIAVEPGPKYDVNAHWEDFPAFGQYNHLLKEERGLPW